MIDSNSSVKDIVDPEWSWRDRRLGVITGDKQLFYIKTIFIKEIFNQSYYSNYSRRGEGQEIYERTGSWDRSREKITHK